MLGTGSISKHASERNEARYNLWMQSSFAGERRSLPGEQARFRCQVARFQETAPTVPQRERSWFFSIARIFSNLARYFVYPREHRFDLRELPVRLSWFACRASRGRMSAAPLVISINAVRGLGCCTCASPTLPAVEKRGYGPGTFRVRRDFFAKVHSSFVRL